MTATAVAHGVVAPASPWARRALPEPLRSELASLVPENWTIGVSVSPDRAWFRAWANGPAGNRVRLFERRSAEAAVRDAIAAIGRESA